MKILFFLILSITLRANNFNIFNASEQEIIKKYQKNNLKFGIESSFWVTKKIDNKNLVDILEEMFNEYLNLEVKIEIRDWPVLIPSLSNDLNGILLINRTKYREKILEFTDPIVYENLYLASSKEELEGLREVKGKRIYVTKNSIENIYFKDILKRNKVNVSLIGVDTVVDYNKEIFLTSTPYSNKGLYNIKVGNLPPKVIGLSKEYMELIPLIDKALKYRYKEKIREHLNNVKREISYFNFIELLTYEELEYLNKLKNISVSYENRSKISYYSDNQNLYLGIVPNILRKIGKELDIDLIETNQNIDTWLKTYNLFKKKQVDTIALVKTDDRELEYLFTNKIYDLPIYKINNNNNNNNNNNIGVLTDSIESNVAQKYYSDNNIIYYFNHEELVEALKDNKIKEILTFDIHDFENSSYDIDLFETVPISLAFQREDIILRNIFDKALITLINKNDLISFSLLEERKDNIKTLKKMNISRQISLVILTIFGILLILFILRFIKISDQKKELLKDPLTKLPNRNVFNKFCKESKNKVGYAIVADLDNFKNANDKYGHHIGDQVLVKVADCLKEAFSNDTLFRISGDEFYAFVSLDEIFDKINYLKILIENSTLLKKYNISMSIGLYLNKEENLKKSYIYADMAMYEAKKNYGFSYKIANDKFLSRVERENAIISKLKSNELEFYPEFQSIFSLDENKIVGLEALARCKDPELGIISPSEFILQAEFLDVIHLIDFNILEKTLKSFQGSFKYDSSIKEFKLSINISIKTFQKADFISNLKRLLIKYDVLPDRLQIEITESIFLKDVNKIIVKLRALKKLGITIVLDDFTMGHSTAALLSILPIDIIKFDISLLDSFYKANSEKKAHLIYKKLIFLSKELGFKITAEGVNNQEEIMFLKKYKVNYIQGYFIDQQNLNSFISPPKDNHYLEENSYEKNNTI